MQIASESEDGGTANFSEKQAVETFVLSVGLQVITQILSVLQEKRSKNINHVSLHSRQSVTEAWRQRPLSGKPGTLPREIKVLL